MRVADLRTIDDLNGIRRDSRLPDRIEVNHG